MLRVASFLSVFFFCSRTSKVRREKINEGEKKKKKKKSISATFYGALFALLMFLMYTTVVL